MEYLFTVVSLTFKFDVPVYLLDSIVNPVITHYDLILRHVTTGSLKTLAIKLLILSLTSSQFYYHERSCMLILENFISMLICYTKSSNDTGSFTFPGALSLVGTPDYSAPEVLKTGVHQIEQHKRMKAAAEAAKWGRTGGAVGRSPINSTKNIGTHFRRYHLYYIMVLKPSVSYMLL